MQVKLTSLTVRSGEKKGGGIAKEKPGERHPPPQNPPRMLGFRVRSSIAKPKLPRAGLQFPKGFAKRTHRCKRRTALWERRAPLQGRANFVSQHAFGPAAKTGRGVAVVTERQLARSSPRLSRQRPGDGATSPPSSPGPKRGAESRRHGRGGGGGPAHRQAARQDGRQEERGEWGAPAPPAAFPARGGARPEARPAPPPPPPPPPTNSRCLAVSSFSQRNRPPQSVLVAAMATPAPHRLENGSRPGQPLGPASPPLFKYFSR